MKARKNLRTILVAAYFSNRAPGLDDVQVGRLFGRFFTVDSAQASTGLGLAIAKLLTEEMGGQITAALREHVLSICVEFTETEQE